VSTIVSFHAHPDDETVLCGGTLAKAADEGHRTVLVTATKGEHGEVPAGLLGVGETLAQRRSLELAEAARILGVARTECLGYADSGMRNTPTNDVPGAFWRADIEVAAHILADILIGERADVLTVYDEHGGYGHPDHIQVHRVGIRAAQIAGTPYVFEASVNRDRMVRLRRTRATGQPAFPDVDGIDDTAGVPEAELTTAVDVVAYLDRKRAAMSAHASQVAGNSFVFNLSVVDFEFAFGTEWYRRRRTAVRSKGRRSTDLFKDA